MNFKTRPELHHDNEFILATFRRRYVAYLIDTAIISIILAFIYFWLGKNNMNITKLNVHGLFNVELEMNGTHSALVILLFKFLFALLPAIYFTISFYFWKGQTIGKHLLRLRVISLYHEHIGFWQSFDRGLGYYASTAEFFIGFIQAAWNPNRMALHDKMAETIVIQLPKKQVPIQQGIKISKHNTGSN